MRPSQEEVEATFSQRNIHDILHQSISYEIDHKLSTWAIGAYIRINAYLEKEYYTSKNIRIETLKDYITNSKLDTIVTALVASVIRSKKNQTIQQVIGYLQTYMPHENHFDRARTAGELIAVTAQPGRLFNIERLNNTESPIVVVNYWPAIHTMFENEFEFIDNTFFNPPLISPPKKVINRHSCGYYTFKEKVLLGTYTQHDDNLDFKSLNILSQIPWVLDPYILSQTEIPPTKPKTTQEVLNFIQHTIQAKKIYSILGQETFYIPWQYDSRGRLYSHGYHINLQSYDYKKVMLNFNHYEKVTL